MTQTYRRTNVLAAAVFIAATAAVAIGLASPLPLRWLQGGVQPVDALEGLDPVMLVQGKEVQGEFKISVTRDQFRYFFANEDNKAAFEKDPARFEIQLSGHCARMGAPVGANPDLYSVHKGRIYIFGSAECKKRFEAAPEDYLEPKNPRAAAVPDATAKGAKLLEKAVKALGGADRLTALSSYREESSFMEGRQSGSVEVKTEMTILFPDRIRVHQIRPDWNDVSIMRSQTMVLSSNSGFIEGPRGVAPVSAAHRSEQAREVLKRPIAMLRARSAVNLHPVFVGTTDKGEAKIDQVEVEVDGSVYTLGLDSATSRILSVSYVRRGPQGKYGKYLLDFSDYRSVKGFDVPFKIAASFDGQPWPEQSATIRSIAIDEPVSPAQFEAPNHGASR